MSQGGKSWCSYQRDQVTGLNTNIPTKAPLPDATLDVVKPVFSRLASVPLLEQCKNCRNQDANESFNSVVGRSHLKKHSIPRSNLLGNKLSCLFV